MRRLVLRREPLVELTAAELRDVAGGITQPRCWGPTTLVPEDVVPRPTYTFTCQPSGHC